MRNNYARRIFSLQYKQSKRSIANSSRSRTGLETTGVVLSHCCLRASKDDESFDGLATNVCSKQIDEPKSYHQDDDARITPLKTNKNISKI